MQRHAISVLRETLPTSRLSNSCSGSTPSVPLPQVKRARVENSASSLDLLSDVASNSSRAPSEELGRVVELRAEREFLHQMLSNPTTSLALRSRLLSSALQEVSTTTVRGMISESARSGLRAQPRRGLVGLSASLLDRVFGFLDERSLMSAQCSDRHWLGVLRNGYGWSGVLSQRDPDINSVRMTNEWLARFWRAKSRLPEIPRLTLIDVTMSCLWALERLKGVRLLDVRRLWINELNNHHTAAWTERLRRHAFDFSQLTELRCKMHPSYASAITEYPGLADTLRFLMVSLHPNFNHIDLRPLRQLQQVSLQCPVSYVPGPTLALPTSLEAVTLQENMMTFGVRRVLCCHFLID